MKNIYVDTGDLAGKLLDQAIDKMETAKKKMGYNYSADAYLEVAISMAKYSSPTGRQSLFNANFAERAGSLYGDIERVLEKLKGYRSVLNSGPDAIADIDKQQKNEITNWWTRIAYRISSIFEDKDKTGEDTVVAQDEMPMKDVRQDTEEPSKNVPIVRLASEEACRGEITYYDQSHNHDNAAYWGDYYGGSTRYCMTACAAMALSYIGIDVTPGELIGIHNGGLYWGWFNKGENNVVGGVNWAHYGQRSVEIKVTADSMLDCYLQDNTASISPVIIGYSAPNGDEHKLLLIGKTEDGYYLALDPWDNPNPIQITISDDGTVTSNSNISHLNDGVLKLNAVWQYSRAI
ncbi:MAG: hypothetical protein E7454_05715 [Ruminococcaceae bacterium]|nr:hypothetical protein [Oscillospiraceae bacterium]